MTPRQRYAYEHPIEVLAGQKPGDDFKWALPAGKTAAVTFMLTKDAAAKREAA